MFTTFSHNKITDKSLTSSYFDAPVITSIGYPGDDLAADVVGGQVITLTGSGFLSAPTIYVGTTQASIVNFISNTTVTFVAPAKTGGTYAIMLLNSDGTSAAAVPGISYSGTPAWSTSSGSLSTVYESTAISSTLSAAGDGPVTYSLYSGTLPPGSSLNSSTGAITGTSPLAVTQTTYSFVIRATDAQNQDTDRSFSITVNPDVVTWSSPTAGAVLSIPISGSSSISLAASSASGKTISYASDVLPAGLSVSGSSIVGTPTVEGTTTSVVTATAAITGKTATRTFSWVVYTSDTYFNRTSLLLQADTGDTFATDSSTNNFQVTVTGDAGATPFTPFSAGYYSNYFNGTTDYLAAASNTTFSFGSGDFTIECWIYVQGTNSANGSVIISKSNTNSFGPYNIGFNAADGKLQALSSLNGTSWGVTCKSATATYASLLNKWSHVAYVRNSGTFKLYLNGTSVASATNAGTLVDNTDNLMIGYVNFASTYFNGLISNVRVVKGTAVYTADFTPGTTPLTSVAGTSLLTCQSNRFVDNSTNNFAVVPSGTPGVKPATPFTVPSTWLGQGSGIFNGGSDNINVNNASTDLTLTGDFTLEYWMYPTSYTGYGTTFSNYPAYSTTSTLMAQFGNNSPSFRFYIGTDGGYGLLGHNIPLFQWTHHAIVRSGSTVTVYENGISIGTIPTSSTLNANNLSFGGYTNGLNPFYGYLSNARIVKGTALYTSDFTPSTTPLTAVANTSLLTLQTSTSASNNTFVDSSQANQLVTRSGTVTQGTFTPYGSNWSNYFDGTGDYISATGSSAFGTANWTVEFWVYPLAYGYTAAGSQLFGTTFGSNTGYSINLGQDINTFRIISNASGSWADNLSAGTGNGPELNTWTHMAVVRNGDNLTIYKNGVQVATRSGVTSWNFSGATAVIGRFSDGSNTRDFTGYISNLRVVNGTAVYTSTFTPSTTPLPAISGTSLLTCQSNRFKDNSTNNFAITKAGDVRVVRSSPFTTGTTDAVYSDASVSGGSAYYQTTTTDYLSVPASENLNLSGDFSIECWVYPTALLTFDWGIIDARVSAGSATSWIWSLRTVSGVYKLNLYTGAHSTGTSAIPLNAWTHVAITRSGSSVKFFVNGVVDGTTTLSSAFNAGANPVYIGSKDLASAGYGTQGYISDLRIIKGAATYTSAFTPPTAPLTTTASTTLALKFANAGIKDNSGVSDWTSVGNTQVVTSTKKYGTGSMYFDGTGDSLYARDSILNTIGSADFTVEFWIKTTDTTAGIIDFRPSGGEGANFYIWISISTLVFYVTPSNRITATTSVIDGNWHHVAVTRASGTTKMFVDGVQTGSSYTDANVYTCGINRPMIGANGNTGGTSDYFNGYLDDLRITNGVARYTSNFTPPAGKFPAR